MFFLIKGFELFKKRRGKWIWSSVSFPVSAAAAAAVHQTVNRINAILVNLQSSMNSICNDGFNILWAWIKHQKLIRQKNPESIQFHAILSTILSFPQVLSETFWLLLFQFFFSFYLHISLDENEPSKREFYGPWKNEWDETRKKSYNTQYYYYVENAFALVYCIIFCIHKVSTTSFICFWNWVYVRIDWGACERVYVRIE